MKVFFGIATVSGSIVLVFWTFLTVYGFITHSGAANLLFFLVGLFALIYFTLQLYRSYRKRESEDSVRKSR